MKGFRSMTTIRWRPLIVWALVLLVSLVVGNFIEAAGFGLAAPLPIIAASVVLIVMYKQARLVSALGASFVLLLIARSVLAPGVLSSTTPIWVSLLILLAAVLEWRSLKVPRNFLLVILLAVALVIPTLFYGGVSDAAKAAGVGAMWVAVFFAAANLPLTHRPKLYWTLLVAGVIEALFAISESLLKVEWLRNYVLGSAEEGTYIMRSNLILGDWTNRAQGTVGYPIPFAAFIAVALVIAVVGRLIHNNWAIAGLSLLFVCALLLSGSRSSFVALGLALAAILVTFLQNNRRRVSKRQLALVFGALGVAAIGATFFGVRALLTNDFSLMHRGGVVESAINVLGLPLARVLFGSGYNSAEALFESGVLATEGLEVVDNTLVMQLVYSGVVGLIILLALLVISFAASDITGRAVLAVIFAFFFFFDVFHWHLITFLMFTFLGFANSPADARVTGLRQWLPSWRGSRGKEEHEVAEKPVSV